jgi:hypothetical protein
MPMPRNMFSGTSSRPPSDTTMVAPENSTARLAVEPVVVMASVGLVP